MHVDTSEIRIDRRWMGTKKRIGRAGTRCADVWLHRYDGDHRLGIVVLATSHDGRSVYHAMANLEGAGPANLVVHSTLRGAVGYLITQGERARAILDRAEKLRISLYDVRRELDRVCSRADPLGLLESWMDNIACEDARGAA